MCWEKILSEIKWRVGFLIKVWNEEMLYRVEDFVYYIEVVKKWFKFKKVRLRILWKLLKV